MSIYDKSSLVLIPSGTKTSKVYSQKPTNGDGDFDFTRSTAATRIAANGNIEKETQNLFLQSNQFDTTWGLQNTTLTSGQSGYNGNDAWFLQSNTANGGHRILQGTSISGIRTFSIYAKAGGYNYLALYSSGQTQGRYFDLANGLVGNTMLGTPADSSIESIGGGWYRCSVTFNGSSGSLEMWMSETGSSYLFTGDGVSGVYIQDAQLNQGLIAQEVITTTTTALYGGITDNVPRLDYTDSSCPALLLEPQRSNLFNQSEYFGSSYWTKSGSSVVSGFVSPDGTSNAFKLVENTGSGGHSVFRNSSTVTLASHSLSCFAKTNGRNLKLDFFGGNNNAIFNLTSGVVISTTGSGLTAEIETFANGWYRCSVTQVQTLTTIYPNVLCADNSNNSTYTGDGTSGLYIYGAQLEVGSYATSYIPTYGTSVTRNADVCNTLNVEDLIGQTEGTLFYQGLVEVFTGNDGHAIALTQDGDGNGSSRVLLYRANSTGNMKVYFQNASGVAFGQATLPIPTSSNDKYAIAYSTNDLAIYVNGVLEHTQSVGVIPTTKFVNINRWTGNIKHKNECKNVLLFKTRLSNEELATLTTI